MKHKAWKKQTKQKPEKTNETKQTAWKKQQTKQNKKPEKTNKNVWQIILFDLHVKKQQMNSMQHLN